jgi:hypothetical protein
MSTANRSWVDRLIRALTRSESKPARQEPIRWVNLR